MSVESPAGPKAVPLSYRLYRLAAVAAFLLALLIVGLGTAGQGPAGALGGPTHTAVAWVEYQMGLGKAAPAAQIQTPVHQGAAHKHHKHRHHKHHRHHKEKR
jgi:hypothetical protein